MSARQDPKEVTLKYLEDNKVDRLFEILTSKVIFSKPNDPNQFLIDELNKMIELRENKQPVRYSELDLYLVLVFNVLFFMYRLLHLTKQSWPQCSMRLM